MNTLETMTMRKSVRSYTGEPISDEELEKILKAGYSAPVGRGMYDNVHITIITNKNLLNEINENAAKVTGDPNLKMLYGAPMLVLVSVKFQPPASENASYSNAACIIENMALEAVELGIGSCHIWGAIGMLGGRPDIVSKFELPEGFVPVSGIILGKTNETYEVREIPDNKIARNYIK